MTEDEFKTECLNLVAIHEGLKLDVGKKCSHDPDEHNFCSAVIEKDGKRVGSTLVSYSNPSALKAKRYQEAGYNILSEVGDVANKVINRGGRQDLHTEVRLINQMASDPSLNIPHTNIYLFTTRSVCNTCRSAILGVAKKLNHINFYVFELRAEKYITEIAYYADLSLKVQDRKTLSHSAINYEAKNNNDDKASFGAHFRPVGH
jgi:hypothetical protein